MAYQVPIIDLQVPKRSQVFQVTVSLPEPNIEVLVRTRWHLYLRTPKLKGERKSITGFIEYYNSLEGSEIELSNTQEDYGEH